jgi:CrcB protein
MVQRGAEQNQHRLTLTERHVVQHGNLSGTRLCTGNRTFGTAKGVLPHHTTDLEGPQGRYACTPLDFPSPHRHLARMTPLIQVALGGALGASARYMTGVAAARLLGKGFPWGTLIVNIAGSFLMGALVVALLHLGSNRYAPLLMTGVLGGFTTFSAFSLDTVTLYERGDMMLAAGYMLASVILSIAALFAGLSLARSLTT